MLIKIATIVLVSLLMNIPFGYLRQGERKLSFRWFLYIHLSIPVIIAMRLLWKVSPLWIPVFIAIAVAGQIIGGKLRPAAPALSEAKSE